MGYIGFFYLIKSKDGSGSCIIKCKTSEGEGVCIKGNPLRVFEKVVPPWTK